LTTASPVWPTDCWRKTCQEAPSSVQHRDSSREAFLQASVCLARSTMTATDVPVSH
ncbi:hypothetical protein CRENBAI_008526, partial [Crenichthys baileyi]